MLGSVYELKLYECVNIKDLSPLNSITVLKLHTCDKIKDVGYLRKLQKLTISLSMTLLGAIQQPSSSTAFPQMIQPAVI